MSLRGATERSDVAISLPIGFIYINGIVPRLTLGIITPRKSSGL